VRTQLASVAERARAVAAAASQWRDPDSQTRAIAREALASGIWAPAVIETALDNALWDLDEARALELCASVFSERTGAFEKRRTTLVILPGNVVGPVIQAAFCAALAGARAIVKASSAERRLADILVRQFEASGPPLSGTLEARHWHGGDTEAEAAALALADRVIAFGEDATIAQIRARAGERDVVGYGDSYSVGFVHGGADIGLAAGAAAHDICMFDQRGCMSPQTVYVAGDQGRALRFAHSLQLALGSLATTLPRAPLEPDEPAAVADFVRHLAATAVAPLPHGLDTLLRGPLRDGVPEYVVAIEPFGQPTCAGFGRIVVVKHAPSARDVTTQLRYYGRAIETIGLAPNTPQGERDALRRSGALRVCELGEMQRPPFGYRPTPSDFMERSNLFDRYDAP